MSDIFEMPAVQVWEALLVGATEQPLRGVGSVIATGLSKDSDEEDGDNVSKGEAPDFILEYLVRFSPEVVAQIHQQRSGLDGVIADPLTEREGWIAISATETFGDSLEKIQSQLLAILKEGDEPPISLAEFASLPEGGPRSSDGDMPLGSAYGHYFIEANLAKERGDVVAAYSAFLQALRVAEMSSSRPEIAAITSNLGDLATELGDFERATKFYFQSLGAAEGHGLKHASAHLFLQLGALEIKRHDLRAAEDWYVRSLEVAEKDRDPYDMVKALYRLGILSEQRTDASATERWFTETIKVAEESRNYEFVAKASFELSRLAHQRGDFEHAINWLVRSEFAKQKEPEYRAEPDVSEAFRHLLQGAPQEAALRVKHYWHMFGFSPPLQP